MRERPSVWLREERFCAKRRQRPPRRVRAYGAAGEYWGGGGAGGAAEEQPRGARGGPAAAMGPRHSLPSAAPGPRAGWAGCGAALGSQTGRGTPCFGGCGGGRAELWPCGGRGPRYVQCGRCSRLGLALDARGSPAEREGCGSGKTKTTLGGGVGRNYSSLCSVVNV